LQKQWEHNIVLRYYDKVNRNMEPLPNLEVQKLAAPLRLQVLDGLRQAIIEGRLAPGVRLTERDLTEMMGVSRTVVREALRQLESEGLVAIIPHKGPVVRELTRAEAKDLYDIRALLEGLAARLFVENANDAQTKRLGQTLEVVAQAYQAGDAHRILDTKNSFYEALFEGAASPTLSAMLSSLHARIWRWRALGLSHPQRSLERSKESVRGLRAIVAAIRKRDADTAEKLTRQEAQRAAAEVMRLIDKTAAEKEA